MRWSISQISAILASSLLSGSLLVPGGAALATDSHSGTAQQVDTGLTVVGFDEEVANANGYEVRKRDNGVEVVVPVTNSTGDLTDAIVIPAAMHGSEPDTVAPSDTRIGLCGTSSIYFQDRNSYWTGFTINPQYGPAVYRTWRVAKSSSSGYQVDNFDGFNFNYAWTGQGVFGLAGGNRLIWVSTGTVTTASGFICRHQGPTDFVP